MRPSEALAASDLRGKRAYPPASSRDRACRVLDKLRRTVTGGGGKGQDAKKEENGCQLVPGLVRAFFRLGWQCWGTGRREGAA